MRIGILGSGLMGGKLGTIFARAGHDVVFSYAGTEQKLNRLAREANGNARAGTPAEAAQNADAILLAVLHWGHGSRWRMNPSRSGSVATLVRFHSKSAKRCIHGGWAKRDASDPFTQRMMAVATKTTEKTSALAPMVVQKTGK